MSDREELSEEQRIGIPRSDESSTDEPASRGRSLRKQCLFLLVAGLMAVGFWQLSGSLTLEQVALRETQLREFRNSNPVLVLTIAILIYVYVAGASIPGATPLTLIYGWYFGRWMGVGVVSFASTAGATVAFLLSRHFFRDWVRSRFKQTVSRFDQSIKSDGAYYLFTLRLIPAVPFFLINIVMGLTPIRTWTFWWVSQLGMLPATVVYVYVGASVPSLQVLANDGVSGVMGREQLTKFTVALLLLAVLPLGTRLVVKSIELRRKRSDTQASE